MSSPPSIVTVPSAGEMFATVPVTFSLNDVCDSERKNLRSPTDPGDFFPPAA